jgi:hypothetical protein
MIIISSLQRDQWKNLEKNAAATAAHHRSSIRYLLIQVPGNSLYLFLHAYDVVGTPHDDVGFHFGD